MKMKSGEYSKNIEALLKVDAMLDELKTEYLFVEGQRDRAAFVVFGCKPENIFTISGNLSGSCKKASEHGINKVVVLTDLDRRGNELAQKALEELQGASIKCDLNTRAVLGALLKLKFFEELPQKRAKLEEKVGKR